MKFSFLTKKNILLLSCVTLSSLSVMASDLNSRLNGLGGNKDLISKAKQLEPNNKIRVVQNRTVDRTWRLEMGLNMGVVSGGDPYVQTQSIGGNLDVHINPMWSVGARYFDYQNQLTAEGERIAQDVERRRSAGEDYRGPEVNYPLNSALGTISFYPVYGKLNMFNLGIAQFDLYVIGGYGQVQLYNGSAPTWTAGGGAGLWLTQNFSSRLEVRYQEYQDKINTGARDMDLLVTTFSIGIML